MKNMNNFATQQLSKKQMNEVKGGRVYTCIVISGDQTFSVRVASHHIGGANVTAAGAVSAQTKEHAITQSCI